MKRSDPVPKGAAERILATWGEDGRFRQLVDGKLVVENPNRGLAKLAFCRKGEANRLAIVDLMRPISFPITSTPTMTKAMAI